MSCQASHRRLLGDHLRIHCQLGLTFSTVSRSCSKGEGCVRPSPLESLEAIHPTQTFSGGLRRRASLSSFLLRKTGPQLVFSVRGANYVTGDCAIDDRLWRRVLSQRAEREDRRQLFCKLHYGERQVDGENFIIGCTCPFMHIEGALPRTHHTLRDALMTLSFSQRDLSHNLLTELPSEIFLNNTELRTL